MKNFLSPLVICFVFLISCQQSKKSEKEDSATEAVKEESKTVEVITELMDFQVADTIPSGWNTFIYKNNSEQTHFFLMDKYPVGKTIVDTQAEVVKPFQEGMDLLKEQKNEEAFEKFKELPEWFGDIQFSSGSGLITKGHTAQTTIKLEPGYYVMECYVKMSNGVFHTTMGMAKGIIVAEENSGIEPPKADVEIMISSEEGFLLNDSLTSGEKTFSVEFKDQKIYDHMLGHDIHLAKVTANADLDKLEMWMNWMNPDGLIEPAPEGITFLGGVNDTPQGNIGYFTATLTPGDYVLIAEVPMASEKNLMKKFSVK